MSLHQLNSKNNALVDRDKTISRHKNILLSSVAKDGKDRPGLKLGQLYQV